MPKNATALARDMEAVWDAAEAAGRDLTPDERVRMEELIVATKSQHSIEQQIRELGGDAPSFVTRTDPNHSFAGGGPGDVFIKSQEYQRIQDASGRGQSWSTGPVEVAKGMPHTLLKGTLLETGVGGPGGGPVSPFYEPGVVDKLFEPLGVSEVFGQSQTTASQIRYVVEGTATSGAAGVAEGAAKPESTLVMSEPPRRSAGSPLCSRCRTRCSRTRRASSRTSTAVCRCSSPIEEERQLLRGLGSGSNELLGIFGRSGINTYTKLATDDNAVALARVIANTRGSSFLAPDCLVIHPSQWLTTRLLRDGTGGTAGQFYGGGPFTGAYGNTGAPGLFGESLWGVRVVLSTVVGSGTALVGNFGQGAHIWRRGGLSVEASNSHDTFFVKNLNMLRAEERLGLGVYRPAAFTAVSGLT